MMSNQRELIYSRVSTDYLLPTDGAPASDKHSFTDGHADEVQPVHIVMNKISYLPNGESLTGSELFTT